MRRANSIHAIDLHSRCTVRTFTINDVAEHPFAALVGNLRELCQCPVFLMEKGKVGAALKAVSDIRRRRFWKSPLGYDIRETVYIVLFLRARFTSRFWQVSRKIRHADRNSSSYAFIKDRIHFQATSIVCNLRGSLLWLIETITRHWRWED